MQAPATGQMLREGGTAVNVADLNVAALGGFGFEVVDDTAEHVPGEGYVFVALHFLTDSVIDAVDAATDAPVTGGTLASMAPKAGMWIFGKFTSVTLTSGDAFAYRGLA
jgi:hypothetical protein